MPTDVSIYPLPISNFSATGILSEQEKVKKRCYFTNTLIVCTINKFTTKTV